LKPNDRVAFSWDDWIDDDHTLEVEIEGINKKYEIDKIRDL
jgi:hypothetical protein